jgi:2-alkyl-3-oxoalkanoate reductase
MPVKVLVTGGTGFLGQHLARALLEAGYQVYLGGRHFSTAQPLLKAGAVAQAFDLRDREATVMACTGMEIVCHVGALSAPWGKREEFFATNVEGTRSILEGCRRHKVQRLIHISSPSVIFDGCDQLNVTDTAPYPHRFLSVYSLTKKIAEDLVNEATDLKSIILRPKALFGPGDQALLPRLVAAARAGRLPMVGDGRNRVDLTYVDNVVQAIKCAIENQKLTGTYTITNDEHVVLWDVIKTVLDRLGIPNRLRPMPPPLARTLATALELQSAITHREPLLTRYTVALLYCTQTYDISATKRELGYRPVVSVAEGIERTLASLAVS